MELFPLKLSELAGAAAARLDVLTLEGELPALPVTALYDLLPHLSLFYLDRLQGALQQQGVSLEPKWKQLCQELVGKQVGCRGSVATQHKHPHDEGETTWHERFMGLLFRVALGGLESAVSRKHLVLPFTSDPRFCALEMCAPHVRRLAVAHPLDAFCSLLQPSRGPVLSTLARTLTSLTFKHLGFDCCPTRERLGAVVQSLSSLREVSFERCLTLRAELLDCVLSACVASERAGKHDEAEAVEEAGNAKRVRRDTSAPVVTHSDATAGDVDNETELLYSDLSPEEHCSDDNNSSEDLFDLSLTEGPRMCCCRKTVMPVSVATVLECLGIEAVDPEGSCDFYAGGRGPGWDSPFYSPARTSAPTGPYRAPCPPLTVTVLRLVGMPLSVQCVAYLEDALSRWICLEKLVLIDTDLRDDALAVPMLTVAGCVLSSFPRLRSLLLATVLPVVSPGVPLQGCRLRGALPPCQLRELSLCSCSREVNLGRLLELLEATCGSLRCVSLRGRTLAHRDDLATVLHSLAAPGNRLDSLRLEDMGTRLDLDTLAEAVRATRVGELALRHCPPSFEANAPRWDALVLALRQNANLRRLVLARNRLGREGLRALASLFSEGAACHVTHLDVSFNCLPPDSLLEFALALGGEGSAPRRLEVLDITGNRLLREPAVARRALMMLRSCVDHVLHDDWDTTHAFADHVSVM
ncbi:leucine-rich repeat-containing protein 41 isoform X2 [Petromyzon marinus]|uniref:leucine-rich repeat-containing protein 41 isoform X2 n=1 Tax=Petromyzon marinus TaxID=7757 RepID=UPI003F6F6137